jgi:FkbM family methyltransferase
LLSQRAEKIIKTIVPRSARNWLRSPSKSIEWLWDSLCFSVGVTKELDLLPGWPLVCHPRVHKTFLRCQLTDPEQSAEFRNFVSFCDRSMCLFDIGASYGAFSIVAAHFGGTAIAVDPSPIATRLIRLQTRLNGYDKNIRIVEACVSDTIGETEMLSSGVFSDGYFRIIQGRSSSELTKTRTVTIDQLADQFGPPTHIKIDVEGYEAAVVRGAKKTLTRLAPLLFLELHNEMIRSEGGDPNRVLDDLAEMGYEMFSIDDVKIERTAALQMPICRLVGKRRQSV